MLEASNPLADQFPCDGTGIGEHIPVGGCQDCQLEGRLLVRLLEGGIHAPGICGFELGVQVDLAIGVDEAVQPLSGAGKAAYGVNDDRVTALREILQRQPIAVELIRGKRAAIKGGGTDLVRDHVQVGRPAL